MSYVDYEKAQKQGVRAFRAAIAKGENGYLPVLDEILKDVDVQSEVNLGLVQIPLSSVVGTSTKGRTYAFANNFMPLMDLKSEFGSKWGSLCDSHMEEGIRDPIKVYEYLNRFYVVEGNKRVSVLKYFDAVNVPAMVTRKIPKLSDDPKIKIYYEFLDFYKLTEINYIDFSQEGSYKKLLDLTAGNTTEPWTDDQKMDFGSANNNFCRAFKAKRGDKLPSDMTLTDAFLIFIEICGYEQIKNLTQSEMAEKINLISEEFAVAVKERKITLQLEPSNEGAGKKKLMDFFSTPKIPMAAFIYDKDPKESDWLYAHELGRLYLDENCKDKVKTVKVHNLNSEEDTVQAMEDLVKMGVNLMFTTSSQQVAASLKVAAKYPEVTILNCSLNTSPYKLIKTYYARLYEVKFLAGMIAGALTETDKIGYLADYPITGMPANINAFAIGAAMVNPRAKVHLEWTTVKGVTRGEAIENFKKRGIDYISDQVMIAPTSSTRRFGLYCISGEDAVNIAMPVYDWGIFYERIIDQYIAGVFKNSKDNPEAINYWWGLSAGVVDIICSKNVPTSTMNLVNMVKNQMKRNTLSPFMGRIVSQNDEIKHNTDDAMSPGEIVKMNWLVENVVGDIPEIDKLKDAAKSLVNVMGVNDEDTVIS
jgi:basic membrane lipoprotein Med (substrate-binding protein (PBP1-ABC) superfamily)